MSGFLFLHNQRPTPRAVITQHGNTSTLAALARFEWFIHW
ncbi:hypothetical protein phiP47_071 [Plesiomonas phage phiP4-7]|nr:hypothetical protein phiP47_071 [Plesiomonas phage phiP4-7]